MNELTPLPATQTHPIGVFDVGDLPGAGEFAALRAALLTAGAQIAFRHQPDRHTNAVPAGLRRGHTVFGPGRSVDEGFNTSPVHRQKTIASVVLDEAVLFPRSMAILSGQLGLFAPSIGHVAFFGSLAALDDQFIDHPGGGPALAHDPASIERRDEIALVLGGVGLANYGHFLYDGLPGVLLHKLLLPGIACRIVGPELQDWQREALGALGLLDDVLTLERPTRFRKILTTDMLSLHVSYPTRAIRMVFDMLRFRFGVPDTARPRVMIRRNHQGNRRVMRNRDEVEAIARSWGFHIVSAETMSLAEQVRCFAGARVMIGESGAAMANIGFADPGARVLEIQPECFLDGWTRGACRMLGHDWHVSFARVPDVAQGTHSRDFSYDVDTAEFTETLRIMLT